MPSVSFHKKLSNALPSTSSSDSNDFVKSYSLSEFIDLLSADSDESSSSNENETYHKINDTPTTLAETFQITQLFPTVTKRYLEHYRNILKLMETAYEIQVKNGYCMDEIDEVADGHTKPRHVRVEIIKGSNVYMDKTTKHLIEALSKICKEKPDDEWRHIVRLALFEIYGNSIKNYSRTGVKSSKPGINPTALKGIYAWAYSRMTADRTIQWKKYVNYVNSTSDNK
ncbi:uncharacterized protein LOC126899828 [Daktulosphaira vitifoliae]|uniref:uncharacterized protein LOC126899828 n=1 Tax=Daktulosphaira vitifoliae TaxID=58002 RepID=UPI0021A9BDCD|nr:uncharacterized protein LOC126899828 [Daktulosphaira vitifoliae]XP_050531013.1 uncharacterized protein LOC126899828 [Daktulosphaira vitifoliae]